MITNVTAIKWDRGRRGIIDLGSSDLRRAVGERVTTVERPASVESRPGVSGDTSCCSQTKQQTYQLLIQENIMIFHISV
jgi:hypothetical protein